MMGVLVSTQARSHNYLYINYRGRLEILQTIRNQRTKVRWRRSYLHSEGQRLFDKHLWLCILSTGFLHNLCTCTVYVLKAQEVKLNENCCHRKNTKKPLNKLIFCIVSTDSVEEDFVSDTDDEDELSVVVENEDQFENVCITLLSKQF